MSSNTHRSALRPSRSTAWAVCVLARRRAATSGDGAAPRAGTVRTPACIDWSVLALAIMLASSPSASAQYSVAQVQPLAFGYLTQGVTEIVPYTDTFRRGVVSVNGAGQAWIRLVLPTTLVSLNAATIPLQFVLGDVAEQEPGKPAAAFDPMGSTRVNLDKGTVFVFIGGRALPALNQRSGLYSATMTVIVSPTKF